ncbi:SPOR domain-containing protein [Sulfitobacter sp. F26169L]|uniref:SPOR domain-containing protein n=1 Tax=Sulfitobacter sp. F26169L TaxID=2996015 RepID=UPI002260898C|nr:SPOR domain-containing protein [Sulfitobacter sp. F26169L]MCX7566043.1 SPOR domain-containing protein [Sulfitobacter sp. F26169L]
MRCGLNTGPRTGKNEGHMGSQINQTHTTAFRRPLHALAGTLLMATLLAGCDEQGQFAFPSAGAGKTDTQAKAVTGPTIERDVEAPEIFSVTDQGLWDGRPSLGGVWVAHPDVTDPERVIIRNQDNGKFVVGALFRRERDIPGPSLQISSDAAVALGILAGAPTKLNVTALRKVEEPDTSGGETATDVAIESPAQVTAAPLDNVTATADAAITAAAPTPPAPKPAPAQKASRLSKPFIQIGIFSIQANADRAAKQMRSAGLSPTVKQSQINGKTFWRVVVGPATTSAEQSKILSTIKSEGFTDAYAVSS